MRTLAITLLALAGCGPVVALEGETSTSGDPSTDTTATTMGVPPDPSTTFPGTTFPGTTASEPTTATSDTGLDTGPVTISFISEYDVHRGNECSIWEEDCPRGEKCMPWANDGGNSWNATRCSPVVDDPRQVGESCTVQGNGVSGIDDCELHSMCWNVDVETNMGECAAFCVGSEANPTCELPNQYCAIGGDSVLILCLSYCYPLTSDCDPDEACVPSSDVFTCVPDASGDEGALGDPCEYINVCDPGLFCADAESVPECEGSSGCCAAFCELGSGEECDGWETGIECVAWFEPGQAPEGYENLGACMVPD